ncbi:MAG: hypothetical protein KAJ55_00150 [Anaerolineales bacterium]|nr:hypothetical protein [Anaerolineales bacterium]
MPVLAPILVPPDLVVEITERCFCGDTQCPSCGTAQGTYVEPQDSEVAEVVAWEYEYACGHRDIEAGTDPAPYDYCPWECEAKLKASRPLTYAPETP